MALVITLAVLVMVTVLVIALLTLATGERSASSLSLQRTQAEVFADTAADRAMASIDVAIALGSGAGKSWASEPGRITTFTIENGSGAISRESHDLFSAAPNAATGNVDLNAPSLSGNYPIAPPATGNSAATMKIGWKNILRDPSQPPSEGNPIVGRVAYWVDDESCKVNINTADGSRKYSNGRYGTFPTCSPATGYSFGFGTPSEISLAGLPGLTQADATVIADTAWDEEFNSISELARAKDSGGTPVVTLAEVDALRFDITHYNSSPDLNFMGEPRLALLSLFNNQTPVETSLLGEIVYSNGYKGGGSLSGGVLNQLYPQPSQLPRPSTLSAAVGPPTNRWFLHTYGINTAQKLDLNHNDYLVGELIAELLKGTNLKGESFTWPAFPGASGNGFAGKYTDRQMDSITLQILDTVKAAMADQGKNIFTPPGILPEGWLSGEPVLGTGRSPRLNEVRLVADVTLGDPLGYGAKQTPVIEYQYPLLQLAIYTEFYFPKGFAGLPNNQPYEGGTGQSAFYGFSTLPPTSGGYNYADLHDQFSAPPWMNRILHATDQNGQPAGIDFSGVSSRDTDPDQASAALYHPYAMRYDQAGVPSGTYGGAYYEPPQPGDPVPRPTRPLTVSISPPFGRGQDLFPGAYTMISNQFGGNQYPARPTATEITLQGGLQIWIRHVGGTSGYRLSTLAPFESAMPILRGDATMPSDYLDRVLPVNFTIPVPGNGEYLLRTTDPLVNQFPADWEAVTDPSAGDRTMPDPYSYMINTVGEAYTKGGTASRDPFLDPPQKETSGNVSRDMIEFDGDNPGFKPANGGDPLSIWMPRLDPRIPKLARFPSVGALFAIRPGLFPDKTVAGLPMLQQHGAPWRALNMAPSNRSSQQTDGGDKYPDWAMLDLFYVPFLPQKPYGPAVPDNPGPQPVRNLTYGGATIGRININNPPVPYPFAEDPAINTDPPERHALEALFFNLQPSTSYTAAGDPVYTTIDAAGAANLAQAVATYQATNGPFFMAGELANVPEVAAYLYTGVAAEAQSRNDVVRETIGAITTRSNTYSVWVVAQTIRKKPGNDDWGNFEDGDSITAEVRRHYLVERYIETGADGVPGNAVSPSVAGTPNAYANATSTGDPVSPADPAYQPQLTYPLPYRWRVVSMENIQL